MLALFLLAVLQNIDVIMVKRQIGSEAAGDYAAAAVAAKAVVWVAIGIGLYLLPEAARASRTGGDPRRVLARALAVVGAVAVPMLLVYAIAPETVLRLAFGPETVQAADALFVLGCAMTLLAIGYLGVQYMLALGGCRSCGRSGWSRRPRSRCSPAPTWVAARVRRRCAGAQAVAAGSVITLASPAAPQQPRALKIRIATAAAATQCTAMRSPAYSGS